MVSQLGKKLKIGIVGGNGAVGREVIQLLAKNNNFEKVVVLTRTMIDEWNTFDKEKFEFIQMDSLENMKSASPKLQNFDSFFCCLGSRVKRGKQLFYQVDYTFVVNFAELAKECGVPHYSTVSSQGAKPKSWFYYFKVKGQAEEALKSLKLKYLSIMKPGMILERKNDPRVGEKIAAGFLKVLPVFSKVKASKIAETMIADCENYHNKLIDSQTEDSITKIFSNKMILKPQF